MHVGPTLHPLLAVFDEAGPGGRRVGEASQYGCGKEDSGNFAMLLHEHPGNRHPAAARLSSLARCPAPLSPLC